MRKQYHFRPSKDGLYAWDVHRLIELSHSFKVKEVLLRDIKELDESYWFNEKDIPSCKAIAEHAKLIEETNLSYPIILCDEGRVMDGMHRICKAYIRGYKKIKAVQFDKMPKADYVGVKNPDDLPYD